MLALVRGSQPIVLKALLRKRTQIDDSLILHSGSITVCLGCEVLVSLREVFGRLTCDLYDVVEH